MDIEIRKILDEKSISTDKTVENKTELLEFMIELAYKSGKILNIEEVTQKVFEREKLMPTGVGNGVALPHAKTEQITDTVLSMVVLKEPIEYDSLDGLPVSVVLLVLGKESDIGYHLKLLSKISKLLSRESFVSEISWVQTPEEVLAVFDKFNEHI